MFLYFVMKSLNLESIDQQAAVPGLNRNDAYKAKSLSHRSVFRKKLSLKLKKNENMLNRRSGLLK